MLSLIAVPTETMRELSLIFTVWPPASVTLMPVSGPLVEGLQAEDPERQKRANIMMSADLCFILFSRVESKKLNAKGAKGRRKGYE
jgi:hypothetical protein